MKNLNVFFLVLAFMAISSCAEKKADEAAIRRWHQEVEDALITLIMMLTVATGQTT